MTDPLREVRRERIVIAVTAAVVVALLAGGVWAMGRDSAAEGAAGSSPSAAASVAAATLDRATAPSPAESGTAEDEASPKGEATTAVPKTRATATPTRAAGSGQSSSTSSSTPRPTPTKTRKPKPKPSNTSSASTVPKAAHFVVTGKVKKKTYFTVKQLKAMNVYSNTYFSRGKEPPEASTPFVGVRLISILNKAGLKDSAERVTIIAADDYTASFSITQVKADYIDETRPGVKLPMIIAWSEDGAQYTGDHPFRLVMGQTMEGDYNRQYWVKIVVTIVVE